MYSSGVRPVSLDGSIEIRDLGSQMDLRISSVGGVWYVDATKGDDSLNGGNRPEIPVATIGKALSLASPGDRILVMPGTYEENLEVSADDISIMAATYMGEGVTSNFRPIVSGGSGIALTLSQTRRFHARGLYFYSSGAVAILTDGEASCFENCEIDADGGAGVKFHAATAPGFTGSGTSFLGCIFDGSVNGIKHFACDPDVMGEIVQATNCVVRDCQFYGNSGADIADDGAPSYNYWDMWLIEGCKFQDKGKATYLDMDAAGADGGGIGQTNGCMICGNFFATTSDTVTTTLYKLSTGTTFIANYSAKGLLDGSAL